MQILDDWSEKVREGLVGLLVGGHDSYVSLRHLNSTFDAHLNVSALTGRLLFHV